jgi:hypothetical protein
LHGNKGGHAGVRFATIPPDFIHQHFLGTIL